MSDVNIEALVFFILFLVSSMGWIAMELYHWIKKENKIDKFLRANLIAEDYLQYLELTNNIRSELLIKEKLSPKDYILFEKFVK